jgi:hypothetical protein
MKRIAEIAEWAGVGVLVVLAVDVIHVVVMLLLNSSFTSLGVQGVDEMFAFWLPWGDIVRIAGFVLLALSPIILIAIYQFKKRVTSLEHELREKNR